MMKCDPEILLARLCVSGDDNDNDGKTSRQSKRE